MLKERKVVAVAPGSELARLLDEAGDRPLVLDRDGVRYRLERETSEDIWDGYDPRAVRRAIRMAAGSWSDVDVDARIADIYRGRDEGSRPPTRP